MGSIGVFEKLMISATALVFGLIVYVIFIVYNTENITINGITYYCDGNHSYYYEDLGSSSALLPIFNGKTTMLMPTTKQDTIKRTLDYNICKTQNIQRDR